MTKRKPKLCPKCREPLQRPDWCEECGWMHPKAEEPELFRMFPEAKKVLKK